MANEKNSVVALVTGKEVVVEGIPEQVVDLFKGGRLVGGLARLKDEDGTELWINPAHVAAVYPHNPVEPLIHFIG